MKSNIVVAITIILLTASFNTTYGTVILLGQDNQVKQFGDIKATDWFLDHVTFLVAKGIIDGYEDQTFQPAKTMQVDEFIKTMVVALGHNPGNASGYWAQNYIDQALQLNLITSTTFATYNRPITRGEMALITQNTLKAIEGSYPLQKAEDIKIAMTDYQQIKNHKNESAILAVYELGIITGYPDGTFGAERALTRSEASTVIRRIIDSTVRKPFISADVARLSRYEHDKSGLYTSPEVTNSLGNWWGGKDTQYFVDLTIGFMEASYIFDYRTADIETYYKNLTWYLSPSGIYLEKPVDQYLEDTYESAMKNQIIRDVRIVTHPSLVYIRERGSVTVPCTMYYVVHNTIYEDYSGEMGKWYKADFEVVFGRFAVAGDARDKWEYNKDMFSNLVLLSDGHMEVD